MLKETAEKSITDILMAKAVAARRPLSCHFELTYRCNFKCPMCYIRMTDEQAKPYGRLRTLDEWLDMARQVKEAGAYYITLTGGECTTYPNFIELYTELIKMGFRVSLMSNAGAYTPEIKELFRKYPPCGVAVSIYGGSNETYEKVTGDAKGFDKVVENLKFLKETGVSVSLSFTVIKQNVHDYPAVSELAKKLDLPLKIITDIVKHNRDVSFSDALSCRLSPAEATCIAFNKPRDVEKALKEAKNFEKFAGTVPPQLSEEIPDAVIRSCNGSCMEASIFWNGDMQTCISLAGVKCYKPFEVGFETAWQQLQGDAPESFAPSPVCLRCALADSCFGKCAARNFEGTGDSRKPDPYVCQFTWMRKCYENTYGVKQNVDIQDCIE